MEAARRMYAGSGTRNTEDFAALGIPTRAASSFSAAEDEFGVWPENWPAFEVFTALSTQWRVGMAGATGLDYTAVATVLDLHGTAPEHRRERFEEIRAMERAALDAMNEKAKH